MLPTFCYALLVIGILLFLNLILYLFYSKHFLSLKTFDYAVSDLSPLFRKRTFFLPACGIVQYLRNNLCRLASVLSLNVENAFNHIFTVSTILSRILLDCGWYGGILYRMHPVRFSHKHRFSSQNSGTLSVIIVFLQFWRILFSVLALLLRFFVYSFDFLRSFRKLIHKELRISQNLWRMLDPCGP